MNKTYSAKTDFDNQKTQHGALESIIRKLLGVNTNETWADLNLIEWIAYIGVLLVALIMPFLYSRLTTENFLTPKEYFIKMFVPFVAGIFLFGKFFIETKKIKFVKTKLDLPLFLFFVFMAFSVFYSGNISSGIRDLREVFCILLLYPVIVNIFRARWQVDLLLWVFIITGLLTSLIGIMETYNWYFKITANSITFAKEEVLNGFIDYKNALFYIPLFPQLANKDYAMTSVVSTFGNRNYLGTFAMFTAFIPIAFYFYYKHPIAKIVSMFLFAAILSGLYVSRCRAALVGIAIGLLFMFFMIILNDRKRKLVKQNFRFFIIIVSVIFIGLMGISAYTLRNLQTENMFDKLKKSMVLDRNVSNIYERMWVWHANDKTFMSNIRTFLVGMGFASFKHFFPVKEAEFLTERNRETFTPVTFRQAHNDWIQILSEMGIVGLILFLFLLQRFFGVVQLALRRNIYGKADGYMSGEHVLLISMVSAMVAQLLAAVPDFPFHRIETAVYAVIFLSIVPIMCETDFFSKKAEVSNLNNNISFSMTATIFITVVAFLNLAFEYKSLNADRKAREAEMYMKRGELEAFSEARGILQEGIQEDSLPGDPYLKLATAYEQLAINEKNLEQRQNYIGFALAYAEKARKNINYNARSTYHSITFRELHIYYHVLRNLKAARNKAIEGLKLTAGDARSIYYFYLGKIDLDMLPSLKGDDFNRIAEEAEINLEKAASFESFEIQSNAFLAMLCATTGKWAKAAKAAHIVNEKTGNRDPSMLNIEGVGLMNTGYLNEAENLLNLASARSDSAVIRRDLAYVYLKLGNKKQSVEQLKKALTFKNIPPDIKKNCLELLEEINRMDNGASER